MPIVFQFKNRTLVPVDVSGLTPARCQGLALEEIGQIPVQQGNRSVPSRELFEISGTSDDERQVWRGNCGGIKSIGAELTRGHVLVEGDAGMNLGADMRGGEIEVTGNTSDNTGLEMREGRIRIHGHAGNNLGGARPGSRRGMTGGEILVHGNAGCHTGLRQRRGLIAIAGNAGDETGNGMIAGTILIGGAVGAGFGSSMKRGSILLLAPGSMAPTATNFRRTMTGFPVFIRLLLRYLRNLNFPLPEMDANALFHIYRGDSLELGLGEILCRTQR